MTQVTIGTCTKLTHQVPLASVGTKLSCMLLASAGTATVASYM